MIICICNGISDKDIKHIVAQGCNDIDALCNECGIADKCKICRKDVERVFFDALKNQ
jgi:bacterioferritin-associated ferredoxin|tara:strand:+ start:141 stop:311 length:171 start_codon:yes stop_codon:yes gene_type:complete